MAADPLPASLAWFAVRVRPGQELWLHDRLREEDFRVFVPVRTVWRFRNRYARARRAKVPVEFPLLPGYVFVGMVEPWRWWRQILRRRCVIGVVSDRSAGRPLRIPWRSIQPLYDTQPVAPDAQRYMETHREFDVGDQVEIASGPFRGHRATVDEIRERQAKVLLDILGGTQHVAVAVDNLLSAE